MAAITWANVTAFAAALATGVTDDAQTDILAHVNTTLSVTAWGGKLGEDSPKLKLARIFLAAHMGTIVKRSTAGAAAPGAVASKTISATSMSVSYRAMAATDDALKSTSWGCEYIDLRGTLPKARIPLVP